MSGWKLQGRILTSGRDLGRGWVTGDGPVLTGAGPGSGPPASVALDAGERFVLPGLVDVHVHGADGRQFGGDTPEEATEAAEAVAAAHARRGTTTLLATTVTDAEDRLTATVRGLGRMVGRARPGTARIAGVHLEGPWIAPARAGAHRPGLLRPPDPAELGRLAEASGGTVRLVTYAPELPGADDLLTAGLAAGIVMSVGHTAADFATTAAAFAAGATHVTHLGNAMPPLDRRQPGPLGAALLDDRATLEVIADGHHLDPDFLRLVVAVAPSRLVAVTDAVAACGMPDGRYRLGTSDIVVGGGRVALASAPGTLAGSALTMDRALAGLVDAGLDLAAAVQAATATPAGIIGSTTACGHLRAGTSADVVVLDEHLQLAAVLAGGAPATDPDGLLAALLAG